MAGLYVHIPFCGRRCVYCDFFSTTRLEEAGEEYVNALIAEAKLRGAELNGEPVKTLYLGGGTPSLLPLPLLSRLVGGLRDVFDLSGMEEFTIEANPDDVTREWCAALAPLGVNRVSMGIQTLEDDILKALGRRHNSRQAVEAVACLHEAGIRNLSLDLIYGLPGQTLDSWALTLEQTLALSPCHLSAYALSYEKGTVLWHQRERGEVIEVPEEECLEMYRHLVARTREAGFEHYEISNFALPGSQARHNSSYWDGTPYLGLGAGAHSYDGENRRNNPCDLSRYVESVLAGKPACELETLAWWERYDERVMLGLRTARGVDAGRLREEFGDEAWKHFTDEARHHVAAGNLTLEDGERYVLTAAGIMVSDMVMRDLLWDA